MEWSIPQKKYDDRIGETLIYHEAGKLTKSLGLIYEATLPGAAIGSLCRVYPTHEKKEEDGVDAEVIGFRDKRVMLMPFEDIRGVNNDSLVVLKKRVSSIMVSDSLLGRVIDARGIPIDGKGPLIRDGFSYEERSLYQRPSDPLKRERIKDPLSLGVKAIDGMLTVGKGQRIGVFAGSGVGKSVLLGMMAKNTSAQVNVIALIGERGREVREFIERDLGEEGLARSVVIVATSDTSPLIRMRGAFLATSIAEYFRDNKKDVLFLMDSVTRFCMAQREIGLALGEPPASKGYTPSVFSTLPKLLERAGTAHDTGSITGLYTVLVEGDDMDDPIADSARSILDGHIVLSRRLAERNHYPAIDVLQSVSRLMATVAPKDQQKNAARIREWMAVYAQSEDLINIGAYVKGSNAKIDQSIQLNERITQFLRQDVNDSVTLADAQSTMLAITRAGDAYAAKS